MLDQEEIEKRLEGVDPQLCVAFAARCSLRALPFLAWDKDKEVFWYWNKENRPKYILALLSAQQVSINIFAFARNVNVRVIYDVTNALTVITSSAYSAKVAADSVRAAVVRDVVVNAIYAAANASRFAIIYNIDLSIEVQSDLDSITSNNSSSAFDFIASPLWSKPIPESWQSVSSRFTQSLINLDAGFEIWVDWYNDRLASKPLNL